MFYVDWFIINIYSLSKPWGWVLWNRLSTNWLGLCSVVLCFMILDYECKMFGLLRDFTCCTCV